MMNCPKTKMYGAAPQKRSQRVARMGADWRSSHPVLLELNMKETQQLPEAVTDELATPWREHHPPGLMSTVGPYMTREESTGTAYALRIDERHLNPIGIVHGGTLTLLMDQAVSSIARDNNGGAPCLTIQMSMNFLRASKVGSLLVARGKVTHQGGSMLFIDGTIHSGDTLLATAQAVMKRLRQR